MAILERMRSVQDMNKLKAKMKVAQDDKQERQTQLDPLQQDIERMIKNCKKRKGQ
jgi:hypothetical protein